MANKGPYTKGILYVTFLFAILGVTSSEDDKFVIHLNHSSVLLFRHHAAICEKETGVPASEVKKLIDAVLPDEPDTKKFLYCVVFNIGYVDKDGHFNVDTVIGDVANMVKGTKEEFADFLKGCNDITLENHIETTYAMSKCMRKKCIFTLKN